MSDLEQKIVLTENHILGGVEFEFEISSEIEFDWFSLSISIVPSNKYISFMETPELDVAKKLMAAAIDLERSIPGSIDKHRHKLLAYLLHGEAVFEWESQDMEFVNRLRKAFPK